MLNTEEVKIGDWVEVTERIKDWCVGDTSWVVYISGDFVDVDATVFKHKKEIQRFHKNQLKILEVDKDEQ